MRPAVMETTALGAACLAGLAVGSWPDLEAIGRNSVPPKRFVPGMDEGRIAELVRGWRRAVERSRNWVES